MTVWVHVAVGVIRNDAGQVLLAKRPDHVHQGGLWEFPGGKVEQDETVKQALVRELQEELGIEATELLPLIKIHHHYSDKSVLLDVWEVNSHLGIPKGVEGQPLQWVDAKNISCDVREEAGVNYRVPAANRSIVTALQLSSFMAITGHFDSIPQFQTKLETVCRLPMRPVVYLRPPSVIPENFSTETWLETAVDYCVQTNTSLQISSRIYFRAKNYLDSFLHLGKVGLHLTAADLLNESVETASRKFLLGASCHNESELRVAKEAGVDYVTLSPVLQTASHPNATTLGWQQFSELTQLVNVPVYALGGLSELNLRQVRENLGQGVAGIGAFWR